MIMYKRRRRCVLLCSLALVVSCGYFVFLDDYFVSRSGQDTLSTSVRSPPYALLGMTNDIYQNGRQVQSYYWDEETHIPLNIHDQQLQRSHKQIERELYKSCRKTGEKCKELKELIESKVKSGHFLPSNLTVSQNSSWSSETLVEKGYTVVEANGSAINRLPQVIIIGAKKAGTRALLQFLRLHPSVRAAGPELHFFDRFFHKGPEWYRSRLPLSMEGQLTVEKTPAYFVAHEVPSRVKDMLPSVNLLLVVRNPVTRALSDYTQSISKHTPRGSFTALALKNSTTGLVNVNWGPVNGGLYARHLQRWRKFFPPDRIHVVSGEALVVDPAGEMAGVQDFLGLKRVINDRHFFFNATKGFPCLVKRERSGRPHCLGSSKGRPHPEVDANTIGILSDFYRPFNFKFYKLVGRNFGWENIG